MRTSGVRLSERQSDFCLRVLRKAMELIGNDGSGWCYQYAVDQLGNPCDADSEDACKWNAEGALLRARSEVSASEGDGERTCTSQYEAYNWLLDDLGRRLRSSGYSSSSRWQRDLHAMEYWPVNKTKGFAGRRVYGLFERLECDLLARIGDGSLNDDVD